MNENGKGSPVSVSTRWTGDILDSSYFILPQYEKYRRDGSIKIPFWLQPDRYYCGAAWYRKDILIPRQWNGRSIELFLERCHWQSSVWIDGVYAGMQNALSAPHRFDLTGKITAGAHTITIRVDNRIHDIDPGVNSSSLTDNTQTNWNGIVGAMYLACADPVHITSLQLYPDVRRNMVKCVVEIDNSTPHTERVTVAAQASAASPDRRSAPLPPQSIVVRAQPGKTSVTFDYAMGKRTLLWDEFSPNLYSMACTLSNRRYRDTMHRVFGMRMLGTKNTNLTVNDSVIFLRGTLECAVFPKTGYPPVDLGEWMRIFTVCKQYGLNHMRFHSWCPPEAAFTAADRLGMYLYIECSSWANPGTSIGDGKPIDRYIMDESRRIVDAFGNHPSFCFLAYGNEPSGPHLRSYLTDFIESWKKIDNRRLYSGASGWPVSDSSDFHVSYKPRIQHWTEGVKSIINRQAPSTAYDWSEYINQFKVPIVSHEIGEWCAYPDFRTIAKYSGALHATSLEIFQQSLIDSGMGALAGKFLDAS
jgi:beta-galactosidase/beta-glucuronidase